MKTTTSKTTAAKRMVAGVEIDRDDVYTVLAYANSACEAYRRAGRTRWIVMGDVGQYWVVKPAHFAKLIAAGYEPVR